MVMTVRLYAAQRELHRSEAPQNLDLYSPKRNSMSKLERRRVRRVR
jgi:hypothetical protein